MVSGLEAYFFSYRNDAISVTVMAWNGEHHAFVIET